MKGDGSAVRTSDRLRQRRKLIPRTYMYYRPTMRKKSKTKRRTAASQIAKMLRPRDRPPRPPTTESIAANLRRSTRKRKISISDYALDSSGSEDDDLMAPNFRSSRNKSGNNTSHDELSAYPRRQKSLNATYLPRREGLRPRRSVMITRVQAYQGSENGQDSSEAQDGQDETENGNDIDGDGVDEVEGDGEDEVEEDGDDEEQDGRRRYDLRNRDEVRRFLPENGGKQRPSSPRRVLHQGIGSKSSKDIRKGSSRHHNHKRHRLTRDEDSDDSLLVDELDQGPAIPWMRSGRGGAPWGLGGLDVHSSWGLNVAMSGWGHQGDAVSSGVQTAGPSSKGGADIQPLQLDESISFDDIGGLSEYIDALKEMVFFPLLYPDFFANYHITPPRGVLLCGPPGTGKTLIARALACAASKAGQKVSFYMRKGADVLSKWVGEAERQLKLLFEEAQRNQPSIIFFDEIDGLAPVRSSKQEQIHNSIVSTLLALMDGLDSRGQVVLIGATNRIDAIDGALRRPGRFDREFNFPLPGCEARTEILEIHTRKWKDPPSKELRMELAASCVGYCGADLKALCTEAAIRAFREKYPQVYTSDDKFVIDVDSIRVEKYHFLEAMSTITPAAHRGSTVHSRPLSSIVSPCLQRHLQGIMKHISEIFPSSASDASKLTLFSYGSALPLVYRPRLLICGEESAGLDHVGPAILHQLEKFPVHSLGLPSLLSDASAKTPEEALVHIFGEARRTTPSVLYLPQFQLWWETAHEQLKAVLMTLLEELPSDSPILLLGTSSLSSENLDEDSISIFALRHVYQMDKPNTDDRSKFFEQLMDVVFSVPLGESPSRPKERNLPELPRAPKEVTGLKASELRAKAEAEQHALRRLRMCLRDVCNRILYDKRFIAFHYPVMDEDAPNYRSIIHSPMDMATVLQRVDCGKYLTCLGFLQDIDLIVSNAKTYNGEDYNGARIVSKACELRDVVRSMLSQIDPSLVSVCDKIAAQGGPVDVPDDLGGLSFPSAPVVQHAGVTRASARLRNIQPEISMHHSFEALKRPKKSTDTEQAGGSSAEDKSRVATTTESESSRHSSSPPRPSHAPDRSGSIGSEDAPVNERQAAAQKTPTSSADRISQYTLNSAEVAQVELVKKRLMERTEGFGIPRLEKLYTRMLKGALAVRSGALKDHKILILRYLVGFVECEENF